MRISVNDKYPPDLTFPLIIEGDRPGDRIVIFPPRDGDIVDISMQDELGNSCMSLNSLQFKNLIKILNCAEEDLRNG